MTAKDILFSLLDEMLSLQHQLDDVALNEVALIQTLNELVPGFDKRLAVLRSGAEKVCAPGAAEELEALRQEIGKMKSN